MSKIDIPLWQATRLVSPGPVGLVTIKYRDKVNVIAVGWVSVLSQNPPRLGLAIHPSRYSHDLLRRSGQFGLSIPGRALAEAVARVGKLTGASGVDKFHEAGLSWAEPREIEAPLIQEAIAWIECAVVDAIELGDHTLFIGEVLVAQAEEAAFKDTWLLPDDEEMRPLVHLGGNHYALLGGAFTVTLREGKG